MLLFYRHSSFVFLDRTRAIMLARAITPTSSHGFNDCTRPTVQDRVFAEDTSHTLRGQGCERLNSAPALLLRMVLASAFATSSPSRMARVTCADLHMEIERYEERPS